MEEDDDYYDERLHPPAFGPGDLALALSGLSMLGDDPYLSMQASNVGVVDNFLNGLEDRVLQEFGEEDGTPTTAFFLQAQTQMWIFALYEVVRTWRERARNMVSWSDNKVLDQMITKYRTPLRYVHHGREMFAERLERLKNDPEVVQALRDDLLKTEQPFTWMEVLRMTLAKHEVAKVRGSIAYAPGYGRIDRFTGSIQYEISNDFAVFDTLSRRQIANSFRAIPAASVPTSEERRSFKEYIDAFRSGDDPMPFEGDSTDLKDV